MVPVGQTVAFHLFRDGRGILAQVSGDLLEGQPFPQRGFDIGTVLQREMLLVSRYIFTHGGSPSTAARRNIHLTTIV